MYYSNVKDLKNATIRLKNSNLKLTALNQKINISNKKIKQLEKHISLLKSNYHKNSCYSLKFIIKIFKIDFFKEKDIFFQIIGFIYAIRRNILNEDQLNYFKLLGQKYLNRR